MHRIYFLDVTVFRLEVDEGIVRDAEGSTHLAVTIDLMDLPSLIVRRNELLGHTERDDNRSFMKLDYNAGGACHFTAERSSLVDGLKGNPLRIGIYRTAESEDESRPFEFGGTFNLIDPGDNPAGRIILRLVLTDLGRRVMSSFALDVTGFVTKNYLEGAEYKCVRSESPDHCDEENSPSPRNDCSSTESFPENLMRDIAGISLGACRLSLGKTPAKRAHESLEAPGKVPVESKSNAGKADDKRSKKKSNKKTNRR